MFKNIFEKYDSQHLVNDIDIFETQLIKEARISS